MNTEPAGFPRRSAGSPRPIAVIFTLGILACVLSSFATPLGTPVLLGLLVLSILFLPHLMELLVVLFPLALLNPQLRMGTSGMVVSEERTFHPININMSELFVVAILAAWLVRGRNREGERAGAFLNVPLVLVAITAIAGMAVAVSRNSGIKIGFEKIFEPLVVFFVITHIRWDRRLLRRALAVLMTVAVVVSVLAVWDYYHSPGEGAQSEHFERLKSGSWATNILAAFLALVIPAAFLWAFYAESGSTRLLSFFCFGLLVLGLTLTYTRTAWIATLAVLGYCALRFRRAWPLLLISVLLITFVGTADVVTRATTLLRVATDESILSRVQVWKDSVDMIIKNPLAGIGFGSFPRIYHNPLQNAHPHNDFLYLALDMGIAGMILMIILLVRVLAAVRRASRLSHDTIDRVSLAALGGGAVTFLIQANLECLLAWTVYSFAFWFFLGLTAAYARSVILDTEDRLSAEEPTPAAPLPAAGPG